MERNDAIVIRPARPGDLPALGRLGAELARVHHAIDPLRFFLVEPMEEGYSWWLGKEMGNPRAVILAAVRRQARRGRVIGYAYGRIEPRDWNALRDRCGMAIDLFVDPGERRAGVGRQLVLALVAALVEKGAPRVVLLAASRNARARKLFSALGFRETMVEMALEASMAGGSGPARRRRAAREPP